MVKKHDVIMRITEVPETLHMSRLHWKMPYNSRFTECWSRVGGAWEITSPIATPASHHSLSRTDTQMSPSGVPRFLVSQCSVLHHRQSPVMGLVGHKLILVQCLFWCICSKTWCICSPYIFWVNWWRWKGLEVANLEAPQVSSLLRPAQLLRN